MGICTYTCIYLYIYIHVYIYKYIYLYTPKDIKMIGRRRYALWNGDGGTQSVMQRCKHAKMQT